MWYVDEQSGKYGSGIGRHYLQTEEEDWCLTLTTTKYRDVTVTHVDCSMPSVLLARGRQKASFRLRIPQY